MDRLATAELHLAYVFEDPSAAVPDCCIARANSALAIPVVERSKDTKLSLIGRLLGMEAQASASIMKAYKSPLCLQAQSH
jgi:hypothetical protein